MQCSKWQSSILIRVRDYSRRPNKNVGSCIYSESGLLVLFVFFICSFCIYASYSSSAKAELSYNFTQEKSTNGIKKYIFFRSFFSGREENSSKKKTLNKITTNKNDRTKFRQKKATARVNKKNANISVNKKSTVNNSYTITGSSSNISKGDFYVKKGEKILFGDKENEVKLNIGGLGEVQYFYVDQAYPYKQDILPNGLPYSPATMHNYSIYNNNSNVINMLGRLDVNPEFIHYDSDKKDGIVKKRKVFTIGAKLSQPFYNASKNTDPRLAPQEYVYAKTNFFSFQIGAVNSSVSRMRVDPQKIASGAGGVYGTWWRYVSLPVFNTSGFGPAELNAVTPVYMLYPTLPNEAGFTTQRTSAGEPISNGEGVRYRANGQGYPTQGAYSNKVSFYLNRIKGFSVGVSYSPSTAYTGYVTKDLNQNTSTLANVTGGFVRNYTSVDYRKQFDRYGLGIAASVTYEYGQMTPVNITDSGNNDNTTNDATASVNNPYDRHDLSAIAVGAQIVYKNYSIAYSYGYWGNSMMRKNSIIEAGKEGAKYQIESPQGVSYYHTAGFGANYGPVRLGVTYMRSSLGGNKLDVWSVGTDYKIISLRSLKVQTYFEYVGYIFHTQNVQVTKGEDSSVHKAVGNNGYVITAGIRVMF